MNSLLKLAAAALALALLAPAAPAQDQLDLPELPDGLSEPQHSLFLALPEARRDDFQQKRQTLADRWSAFLQHKTDFVNEYQGTEPGTPRADEAERRKAELTDEANKIVDDADTFTQILGLTLKIESLDAQIKETERQMAGLGFKQRAEDFEQITDTSAGAMAHLKARLLSRIQELVTDKAQDAMQEHFLAAVKDLKPKQVKGMLAAMEKAGVTDPYFLEWLRSFQPNKPRARLVADAKVVIKFLKDNQDLAEASEKLEAGTVEADQDAALTLLSLVIDNPCLSELKAVGGGTYDVGEAWFYLAVLDMSNDELSSITDRQLSLQKVLIKRMESLVKERNQARTDLANLPAS